MKKLSTLVAKLTGRKLKGMGVLAAATLAGAVLMAGAPAAQAQRFGIGVQFGGPRYYAPAPPVAVYGGAGYGYGAPAVYGNGYYGGYAQPYGDGDGDGWRNQYYGGGDDHRGWGDGDGDRRGWGGDDHRGWGGGDDHRGWGGREHR